MDAKLLETALSIWGYTAELTPEDMEGAAEVIIAHMQAHCEHRWAVWEENLPTTWDQPERGVPFCGKCGKCGTELSMG